MRLFVVFFAVVFLVNTNVMGQDSVMWLRLKDFEELLESGRLKGKIDTITIIVLENNNNTLQTPLSTNQELPESAVLFSYMGEILKFKKIQELRLFDVFLTDLLTILSLQELKKLELCFSLSANANVNHIIKVLLKLKSLEELDLNHSRLTMKNRDLITKKLTKKGVKMNDWLFLDRV